MNKKEIQKLKINNLVPLKVWVLRIVNKSIAPISTNFLAEANFVLESLFTILDVQKDS